MDTGAVGLAAGAGIAGQQRIERAKTTDRPLHLAEAPGRDADPAQVSHRVAQVGQLPIEHADQRATRRHQVDHQVAVAEITMHQPGHTVGRGVLVEPAQRQLEHRPRRAMAGMPLAQVRHLGPRLGHAQGRQTGQRQRVDAGQRLATLAHQGVALGIGDAPTQGFSGQALHHEARAQAVAGLQHQHHFRHRHAGGRGAADQLRLGRQAGVAVGANGRARWRPAQDQLTPVGRPISRRVGHHNSIEGPGLLAGPARQAPQALHLRARSEHR